jgi:virginiamycin A acetyltransferase
MNEKFGPDPKEKHPGVKFIMNGAYHKMSGISTYPFSIFRKGWESVIPGEGELPYKGDTVVGNDVWIGYDALIMAGSHSLHQVIPKH